MFILKWSQISNSLTFIDAKQKTNHHITECFVWWFPNVSKHLDGAESCFSWKTHLPCIVNTMTTDDILSKEPGHQQVLTQNILAVHQ